MPGGNLQTIWSAKAARRYHGAGPRFRRERWTTPDEDFIDVDWLDATRGEGGNFGHQPLLVLFHGLEGSSSSHYAEAFAHFARARSVAYAVPHFRGCSGELNRAPRSYFSGDFEEIGWILARFRAAWPFGPVVAVGISLGGNALMRWASEVGPIARASVDAIASVCSPLHLAASGAAIDRGFNRQVYARMFLRTMREKAARKWAQFPGLFDLDRVRRATTLREFDDAFTAPVHGYAGVDDYYAQASAAPRLTRVAVPALALNAVNDPFVPIESIPRPGQAGRVEIWHPPEGGHVGFASGAWPGHVAALPEQVGGWLLSQVSG